MKYGNKPGIFVEPQSQNKEINEVFTIKEIQRIVKKLKNDKSCRLDHIRNEFLKSCLKEIFQIFVNYLNLFYLRVAYLMIGTLDWFYLFTKMKVI